ncbi:hypothetical protein [Ferruginibacter profundus]
MKYIIGILFFLTCGYLSNAQVKHRPASKKNVSKDNTVIFDEVEAEAEFTGGDTAWRSFFNE